MKFVVKNSAQNYGCFEVCSESGILVYRPPDKECAEIFIQTIEVKTKRKGVGSKLLDKLKKVTKKNYNSAAIRVL
jgi:predicted acetyltransferase